MLLVRFRLVVEAIVEGYVEYNDYNHTTIQSDHGEALYTLLDFLRLKASYDRINWQMYPALSTHQVLERRGQHAAAERWRSTVAEQTRKLADWHLGDLEQLER